MRLRDLLDESLVKVTLESVDKDACIEEMVDLLMRSGRLVDREAALEAIREREACGTTGCGNGCAVPHGRHSAISGVHVALGTSARGIDFEAFDDVPVRLAFLVLASADEPYLHISALFEIARLLKTPGLPRRLMQAPSAAAVLAILDAEEKPEGVWTT
jgi:mannitol/fructose-specific phosphotransferase system IIA component (Ntr-type)